MRGLAASISGTRLGFCWAQARIASQVPLLISLRSSSQRATLW